MLDLWFLTRDIWDGYLFSYMPSDLEADTPMQQLQVQLPTPMS